MTKTPPPPSPVSENGQPPTVPGDSKLNEYRLNAKQTLVVHPENWSNDLLYGGAEISGFALGFFPTCPGTQSFHLVLLHFGVCSARRNGW